MQKSTTRFLVGLLAGVSLFAVKPACSDPGLAYDQDHDVLVLSDCDLAVRYNNKTFVPVKAKLLDDSADTFLKITPEKSVRIYEDYESAGMKGAPEQILIQSYDAGKIGAFGFSRFSKNLTDNNRVREIQFTNERVAKEIGLSDSSFIGVHSVKSFEVAPKSGETPYYLYVLQGKDKLNVFVRKMRGTSRSFDFDPAVIVTQVRLRGTGDCVGNVDVNAPKKVTQ
jgi:hypothetical protein